MNQYEKNSYVDVNNPDFVKFAESFGVSEATESKRWKT